ncbi:dihydroneopterin aldolase [Flavobacteriaceae bacterium]|nr:dihydroneopterin aldolase [Flavobacteriaceae bacterium]
MGIIKVENIKVYAHHGCLKEETVIGSNYRVDVAVSANLDKSSKTDELKDTVDYVTLNSIVVDEMGIPCKLLETVAQRIIARFLNECAAVDWASVSVSKINPPLGGDVEKVTVVLEEKRSY